MPMFEHLPSENDQVVGTMTTIAPEVYKRKYDERLSTPWSIPVCRWESFV